MTALIEHLDGLYYQLTERIAADDIQGVYERALRRQSESGESLDQTDERLGRVAWQDALTTARDVAYDNAIKQSDLRPIGEPNFDWTQCEPGTDCVFTATFEVLPPVDLDGLSDVEIQRPDVSVGDDDVNRALEVLREEHERFTEVSRPARVGDRVTFDFAGDLAGETFEGSSGEAAKAVIGAGDVLDDMDTALIGRSGGEQFITSVTFPVDYARSALRGETAVFRVTVRAVAEPEYPDIDGDFAKRVGIESGSVDELRGDIHQRLESECERAKARYEHRMLTDSLLASVPVAVPEALLEHEVARVRETFESQDGQHNQDDTDESEQMPEEPIRATAERRVKLSLILSEFIRQHDIRLDEKRVEQKLDELASGFALADVEMTKLQYRNNEQVMHNVQALVIEQQALDAIFEHVKKTPVSMSVDSLLQMTVSD